MTKTFREYWESFMKIFLIDFMVYQHGESFAKAQIMFSKNYKEYGISLNLNNCAFMVFSWMILGFIISKEGKLLDPKKVQVIINMPPPKNPQQIQVSNGMA